MDKHKNNKLMSFCVDDEKQKLLEKLLEKYKTIRTRIKDLKKY